MFTCSKEENNIASEVENSVKHGPKIKTNWSKWAGNLYPTISFDV
uniref:Uncharacterized protein n=1 Tax=Arundo donax TaxID=35708 RepID=A0A0A9H3X7_ARUDO